tara:strand:- start:1528 stop:2391 length:864 start_codon:yes stop_codon:yes gene_type:complete
MAVATAATIQAHLIGATYPEGTLSKNNIFDYEQYTTRRRYPSCEVITTQPESTVETKRSTDTTIAFEINYYDKNLGLRTDDVSTQRDVENVIRARMETMVLQDYKVVLESKSWSRQSVQRDGSHPAYLVSTLKITVRQVNVTVMTADGVLKFVKVGSTVDNAPGADYTYTNVFDVDLQSGYRDIEEGITGSHIPIHYAGNIQGRFICSIMVKNTDLGTTGDKLNRMPLLNNGEKPSIKFIYTNKTADDSAITNTFTADPESVQMLYKTTDGVVFRLIAKLITDITIT